jgi:hypothetical protein
MVKNVFIEVRYVQSAAAVQAFFFAHQGLSAGHVMHFSQLSPISCLQLVSLPSTFAVALHVGGNPPMVQVVLH